MNPNHKTVMQGMSEADRVLPSLAGWEKTTSTVHVDATGRSSHEEDSARSGFACRRCSEFGRLAQGISHGVGSFLAGGASE